MTATRVLLVLLHLWWFSVFQYLVVSSMIYLFGVYYGAYLYYFGLPLYPGSFMFMS